MLPCFLRLIFSFFFFGFALSFFPPLLCGSSPLCIALCTVLPVPLAIFFAQRFGVRLTVLFFQISGVDRGALRRAAKATLPDELELLAANHAVGSCNRALGDALFLLLATSGIVSSESHFAEIDFCASGAIFLQSSVHDVGLAAFHTNIRAPDLARFSLAFALFTFSVCLALCDLAAGSAVK